jgi:Beta-propeller domains of methanol dehydrogenase type
MRAAIALFLILLGGVALAAPALPPKPADYVEDNAGLLPPETRESLAARLAQFERDTSSQVLVATFPRVPENFVMEDFTQRTAEAWGVGQREHDNGVVFFIFPEDRRMRIEVGYGLEGAIPDATAKSILEDVVTPAFRADDFAGGVTRGVEAILQAAQGEYEGTGRTVAEDGTLDLSDILFWLFVLLFIAVLIASAVQQWRRGWQYSGGGTLPDSWGGDGWSSGGGGFSGGGGSFGGGGASGDW